MQDRLPTYLIERYIASARWAELEREARETAARISRAGVPLHHVRSIVVPGDELVLSLVEARSEGDVREASKRARLQIERLNEAMELSADESGSGQR